MHNINIPDIIHKPFHIMNVFTVNTVIHCLITENKNIFSSQKYVS